jgi:hypothetical protein
MLGASFSAAHRRVVTECKNVDQSLVSVSLRQQYFGWYPENSFIAKTNRVN